MHIIPCRTLERVQECGGCCVAGYIEYQIYTSSHDNIVNPAFDFFIIDFRFHNSSISFTLTPIWHHFIQQPCLKQHPRLQFPLPRSLRLLPLWLQVRHPRHTRTPVFLLKKASFFFLPHLFKMLHKLVSGALICTPAAYTEATAFHCCARKPSLPRILPQRHCIGKPNIHLFNYDFFPLSSPSIPSPPNLSHFKPPYSWRWRKQQQ